MRKSSVLLFLVALTLIVGIIGTIGIVNAARGDDKADSYRVCVDKDGNMRLETGKKGKCKKNEFAIELPSIQLISLLEEKIGELEDRITELETPVSNFTITSTAGSGGSIDPDGTVTVNQGADLTFTITADTGYHITDVLVDGSSVGALSTYTFPAVTTDHTIAAFFEIDDTGDIIQEDLVLYLPLYEYELDGDTIISRDAYGHTCDVSGAVWRPNGYYFDGTNDKIQVAASAVFSMQNFTLEAWLKPDTVAHSAKTCIDLASAANDAIAFNYNQAAGADIQCWFDDGGAWKSTPGAVAVLSTTEFTHVAVTYDRVNFTEYANGGEHMATTATTAAIVIDSSIIVYIGINWLGAQDVAGTVGEVRIYNRALTPQEIQHNYEATKWRYE